MRDVYAGPTREQQGNKKGCMHVFLLHGKVHAARRASGLCPVMFCFVGSCGHTAPTEIGRRGVAAWDAARRPRVRACGFDTLVSLPCLSGTVDDRFGAGQWSVHTVLRRMQGWRVNGGYIGNTVARSCVRLRSASDLCKPLQTDLQDSYSRQPYTAQATPHQHVRPRSLPRLGTRLHDN